MANDVVECGREVKGSILEFKGIGKGNRLSHKEFQEKHFKNKVILVVQISLLTNIPLISRALFSPSDHIRSPFTFVNSVFFIDIDGHYGINLYLLCLVQQSTYFPGYQQHLLWTSVCPEQQWGVYRLWKTPKCDLSIMHLHSFVKEH